MKATASPSNGPALHCYVRVRDGQVAASEHYPALRVVLGRDAAGNVLGVEFLDGWRLTTYGRIELEEETDGGGTVPAG